MFIQPDSTRTTRRCRAGSVNARPVRRVPLVPDDPRALAPHPRPVEVEPLDAQRVADAAEVAQHLLGRHVARDEPLGAQQPHHRLGLAVGDVAQDAW